MNILALDASNKCGFAHTNGESGVWEYKKKKTDSPGAKWIVFMARLRDMLRKNPTDLVAYEQPHNRGGAATHSGHGYVTCIEYVCSGLGVQVESYHSATIKKHATGKGKASKQEMVDACRDRLGIEPQDDNEADALWIRELAAHLQSG